MVKRAKENLALLLKHIRHHFTKMKNHYRGTKSALLFPIFGFISLLWVIIRVGTKPSRLRYPCMRVAVPTATTFLVYITALFTSLFSLRKAKEYFRKSRYLVAAMLLLISIAGGTFLILHTNNSVYAQYPIYKTRAPVPNDPIGEEKGVFPGRVVWVHDPDATNENCDPDQSGHGWFLPENNDQNVIDHMLDTAVKVISGQTTVAAAWDTIFKYNNNHRGKGAVGYQAGEVIFIKINRTSSYDINPGTYAPSSTNYGVSETSPQLILSLLRHLVNEVGVAQANIYIGDPMKHIYNHDYSLWHGEFSNIHYLDHDWTTQGRELVVKGTDSIIHYSDRGSILREGQHYNSDWGDSIFVDSFYTILEDCDYLINVPTLKGHRRNGMTMFAKNHFGSHVRDAARHLHMGLVTPDEYPDTIPDRRGYGLYRVLVDLMGWRMLREKNLIFLMDALWSAGHELDIPTKWVSQPFNNDWSSSIFISQDNVAIESVGYDFLQLEYTVDKHPGNPPFTPPLTYVQMEGTDDYLRQVADSTTWPTGFTYDPEDDGSPLPSLGVHEHWNDSINKQYSRDLGGGYGIELIKILEGGSGIPEEGEILAKPILYRNSPNPFNNSTSIRYEIPENSKVELAVYNIGGQKIKSIVNKVQLPGTYSCIWNGDFDNGAKAPNGIYIYCLEVRASNGKRSQQSEKMLLVK
jgi:hypothetical protein